MPRLKFKGNPGFGNPNRKKLNMEKNPDKPLGTPQTAAQKTASRVLKKMQTRNLDPLSHVREGELGKLKKDSGFFGHYNVPGVKQETNFYKHKR